MIVVIVGSVILGFMLIALVSMFSTPPPKIGEDSIGGVEIPADRFFDQVENLIHRLGMEVEAVEEAEGNSFLFQAFDPTPVRGARVLVLARADPPGTPVSLEEVNGFSDSLRGHEALKGVMITTAGFLPDAQSGETYYRLELIDGERWLEILGEYGIA